jgi:hypothetical protein
MNKAQSALQLAPAAMPTHSNTTPERLEGWESLDRGSTAAPEPVLKQGYESAQALLGE